MTKNGDPTLKKKRYKYQKHLSSEPAREARRHPGCCFELRRAKRAGAQTRIRLPGACIRPPGNKKMPAPENGACKNKRMPLAPNKLGKCSCLKSRVYQGAFQGALLKMTRQLTYLRKIDPIGKMTTKRLKNWFLRLLRNVS